MNSIDRQHVAVAVVCDKDKGYLLSQRHQKAHQGGLWEFPGGKVESGETVEQALVRELREELQITITKARPLIKIPYDYSDKKVLLDVWLVTEYKENPIGAEGQNIIWVSNNTLSHYKMPDANNTIVTACSLPDTYLISPDPGSTKAEWNAFLESLEISLTEGISLFQFRAKTLNRDKYVELAKEVIDICHNAECKVLLSTYHSNDILSLADGLHLSSNLLLRRKERGVSDDLILGASCHSREELRHAQSIGCDFAVLGPVNKTVSHLNAPAIGWDTFSGMCNESGMPVYALGGMTPMHLAEAWQNGAQGVAGISAFWKYTQV